MKSKYIVFPEPGQVEVCEEEVDPPGPGELLCAAQRSLVSVGTELSCLRGVSDPGTNWEAWLQYPFRPGYSMAARVVAVGKGVAGHREGDRLAGWAEHRSLFKVRSGQLHRVPDQLSDEEATWSTLSVTTQLAVRRAQHGLGETVGVVGLGILGQMVVQYVALSGARRIIAIDPALHRLDMARAHGATDTLALEAGAARLAVEQLTGGRMLDVVYDITGQPAVLAQCVPLLHKLGRVILLGDTPTPTRQYLGPGVVSDSIAILGIHGTMVAEQASVFNPWTREEMVALFFDYLLQGRMRVADLISHRFPAAEAAEVYARLLENRAFATSIIFDWKDI